MPLERRDGYLDYIPAPPPRRRSVGRHVVLFAVTVISTTFAGALHYFAFQQGFNAGDVLPEFLEPRFYLGGLWYSATILAILGCHEMGHYYACRFYRVDATLPYFLPAPPLSGTFGAFIRIRSRIPSKLALFDIGLAGPIAGFLIAVPALFFGLAISTLAESPKDPSTVLELGEPLLFRAAAWLMWGNVPDGMSLNMHPVAFAAWFGLLVTAVNLFPIGQLDGGHVAYALLGRRSTVITMAAIAVAIGLTFFSSSWIVWTILMVVMLLVIGPHHPPTLDDTMPLGRGRLLLAIAGLIMLIVCFTPAPIGPFVMGQ
jgi:membrane-associated protease RseP (regulator of RpoE activity)